MLPGEHFELVKYFHCIHVVSSLELNHLHLHGEGRRREGDGEGRARTEGRGGRGGQQIKGGKGNEG